MIGLYRRFVGSTGGLAAIEFAVAAPMLLLVLIETFDIGNAIAVYMKVRAATFSMAAITNQYSTGSTGGIQATDMATITGSANAILAPYSATPATLKISQIVLTSSSSATVSWSYSPNGTAYTQGSAWTTLPSQFTSSNACNSYPCYLIYSEISYAYTPLLFSTFVHSISMSDSIYLTPRSSACVQYLNVPSTC